jgi:hypothetical protein
LCRRVAVLFYSLLMVFEHRSVGAASVCRIAWGWPLVRFVSYRYALVLLLLRLQASFLPSGSWRSIILAFPTVVAFTLPYCYTASVALVLRTSRGACERNALRLY